MNFIVFHIYRENNECADVLANLRLSLVNYTFWNDVPLPVCNSFARNKLGLLSFKFTP
jgi:hypothetical protein